MEKMMLDEEMANMKLSSEHEDLEKSARKRIEGNALYKAGKLSKAINAYKEAALAAPNDPLPLSNLSAAYFESGQYRLCVQASQQAIEIAGDQTDAIVNKLFPRMMKSLMNLFDWESARMLWNDCRQRLEPTVSSTFDEQVLRQAENVWKVLEDEKSVKRKVLGTLPKYRQIIYGTKIEYYHHGHDDAEPLFDSKLASSLEPSTNLCFAGIGDGRHLFATLISIGRHERTTTNHSKYHITINDINPHSIARLLIFFHIFNDMAKAKAEGILHQEKAMFLTTLYYLFASMAMPPCIFDRVHAMICKIINLLENGETAIAIDVRNCFTPVLRALKSWRDDAPTHAPVSRILEKHVATQYETGKGDPLARGAEGEEAFFRVTGAILAPHLLKKETAMRDLLKKMRTSPSPANVTAMKSYLAKNWKPNVTTLDLDWMKGNFTLISTEHNPFNLGGSLYNENCEDKAYRAMEKPKASPHLYEHVAPFFDAVSHAWMQLNGSVRIEALVGDVLEVFEGFQHDLIDGRSEEYPRTEFDRIHMSNVPDYVGGPLSVSLYAAKILRPRSGHFITASNMLNFSAFPSVNHYNNEYMVISDDSSLSKLMQVTFAFSSSPPPGSPYPLAENMRWQRASFNPLPFLSLCSRPILTKWLHALFFRLSVPVNQKDTAEMQQVRQSLNISTYFRVLSHLHQIGYPGHWLSEILAKILDNDIITSARPPLTSPLNPEESRKNNPLKKISTAPYVLEMRSLSTLFQRILPFAMSTRIPNPDTIFRYQIRIPIKNPRPNKVDISQSALVFHRESLMNKVHFMGQFGFPEPLEHVLRNPLDTMPICDAPLESYQKLSEEGLVVISTFDYDVHSNIASFWMGTEDATSVFGGSSEKDWKASLWGFMFWDRYTPLVTVKGNLKKKEAWLS